MARVTPRTESSVGHPKFGRKEALKKDLPNIKNLPKGLPTHMYLLMLAKSGQLWNGNKGRETNKDIMGNFIKLDAQIVFDAL